MKTSKKNLIFLFTVGICIFITFILFLVTACSGEEDDGNKGILSFKVTSNEPIDKNMEFAVNFSGKTNEGKQINETYNAKIDTSYSVQYGKGEYSFQINTSSLNTDVNIYKANKKEVKYDGKTDTEVSLILELDKEAMQKKQEEKVKKEAEEQQKIQQQQQQQTGEVAKQWILVTTTGTFHLAGCRALSRVKPGNSKTITATYSEMIAQGYKPCGICHPFK